LDPLSFKSWSSMLPFLFLLDVACFSPFSKSALISRSHNSSLGSLQYAVAFLLKHGNGPAPVVCQCPNLPPPCFESEVFFSRLSAIEDCKAAFPLPTQILPQFLLSSLTPPFQPPPRRAPPNFSFSLFPNFSLSPPPPHPLPPCGIVLSLILLGSLSSLLLPLYVRAYRFGPSRAPS